jgi:hypothetical protein
MAARRPIDGKGDLFVFPASHGRGACLNGPGTSSVKDAPKRTWRLAR